MDSMGTSSKNSLTRAHEIFKHSKISEEDNYNLVNHYENKEMLTSIVDSSKNVTEGNSINTEPEVKKLPESIKLDTQYENDKQNIELQISKTTEVIE